ncbi:MAG: GlcG/HbpS family heme-binding protein [Gemmatimonadales bacterium]
MRHHTGFQGVRAAAVAACLFAVAACGDDATEPGIAPSSAAQLQHNLPSYAQMREDLKTIVAGQNGGLGFHMWAAVVDRDGFVLDVLFSGDDRDSEWPGSRAIAAQKANTANSFSLDNFALSSGNLYAPTQPGGSLFGLQESNPVDPQVAYDGNPKFYGTANDPLTGKRMGGINVFGGGLALYAEDGTLLGGIGLSGDTSCTDHIIAWRLRHALNLDNVPAGVGDGGADDNLVLDTDGQLTGFEHPTCFDNPGRGDHIDIINHLATTDPIGPA